MLDLQLLSRVRLHPRPPAQLIVATVLLRPNYTRVDLRIDGVEKIPATPVIFAMNHTDRYNYWPFQYAFWRAADRFTATWVKGKNYEHPLIAKFMEWTNNIPVASRGYLVVRDFTSTVGRKPTDEEYEALRKALDEGEDPAGLVPKDILTKPRSMLGYDFHPSGESYASAMSSLFAKLMERFVEMNEEAIDLGLNLLIFPQGTRSIRLSKGHVGLAQIAMHLKVPIVPVGCNGSDLVYPGGSPIARKGKIVYRIGDPITVEEIASLAPEVPFAPFTREAEQKHKACFRELTDRMMERINGLLDERYQFSDDKTSDGLSGVNRFL